MDKVYPFGGSMESPDGYPDLGQVALPAGFDEIWLVGTSTTPDRHNILRLK